MKNNEINRIMQHDSISVFLIVIYSVYTHTLKEKTCSQTTRRYHNDKGVAMLVNNSACDMNKRN